jgi:deoxyribodipyrimidine photo-lyase
MVSCFLNVQEVNVVWFKRDLRLLDHGPLSVALSQELPVLLLYIFEPSIMEFHDTSPRHWRFVWQSLSELNVHLVSRGTRISIVCNEAVDVFESLSQQYKIRTVYSHLETGNGLTFQRDQHVLELLDRKCIVWKEFQQQGVVRRLSSRINWEKRWKNFMLQDIFVLPDTTWLTIELNDDQQEKLSLADLPDEVKFPDPMMQPGGEGLLGGICVHFLIPDLLIIASTSQSRWKVEQDVVDFPLIWLMEILACVVYISKH